MKTYVVRIDIPVKAETEEQAQNIVIDHANKTPGLDGDVIEVETVLMRKES